MDWFDDYDDEDTFEDEYDADTEMDDPLDGDAECDAETNQTESEVVEFTARDAFIVGGAIGYGYKECRRSRKRKRLSDDSD